MPLPALLTIQSGINQLRYATLKGIMAAKKKEIRKARCRTARPQPQAADRHASVTREEQADPDDRRLARGGRQGAGAAPPRGGDGRLS